MLLSHPFLTNQLHVVYCPNANDTLHLRLPVKVDKNKYSRVCYNEQFISVKSVCYNERGGILFTMESSIIVVTRERMVMFFMCVRLYMLFIRKSLFIVFTKERLYFFFQIFMYSV
jgi:hypothetical protein